MLWFVVREINNGIWNKTQTTESGVRNEVCKVIFVFSIIDFSKFIALVTISSILNAIQLQSAWGKIPQSAYSRRRSFDF